MNVIYVIKEGNLLSDYKRLVSYIYAYNKGEKDKNIGYAKIEIRNGQCKTNIKLKGIYTDNAENMGVYFAVRRDGALLGVKLGNMIIKNGLGDYSDITYPGNINNSGYSFSDISGLFIGNRSNRHNILASVWDEEEVNTSKLMFPEEATSKGEKEKEEKKRTKVIEVIEDNNGGENTEEEQVPENKPTPENRQMPENQPEAQRDFNEFFQPRTKKDINHENDMGEQVPMDSDYEDNMVNEQSFKESVVEESDWTDIFTKNNVVEVFSDDDFYNCVEVNPEELKKLPISDTNIVNNSFLMHGFYGYRHVLFGKVQKDGEKNLYFIGVPGVYSNREKFMSSMFGFNNFKKSHRGDFRNPYFGYWYTEFYL